ncbi:hypothetical protein BIW11_00509 [Tropilaelaps mercedesae]|uniref:Cuticle protein 10.9-like n=1 Tax=Tropilaelaps mercedesae TaxID=418985 RepID=A0A1V9XU29_9ACAR|nr:hypothetical protein BIW11_00509 [Tropilaelaps mercedesae]
MSCGVSQERAGRHNRAELEPLGTDRSVEIPLAPAPVNAIILSRQSSSKVTFPHDGDTRENTANHISKSFPAQRVAENVVQPYDFGYSIQDEYGNSQYRQESGDQGGVVRGSYGYTDALGIYRKVKYIADSGGFRAKMSSNEPGVKAESPASVSFIVEAAPQRHQPSGFSSSSPVLNSDASRQFPSQKSLPSTSNTLTLSAAASSSSTSATTNLLTGYNTVIGLLQAIRKKWVRVFKLVKK